MSRSLAVALGGAATLVILLALHVQLNLGGWPRVVGALGSRQVARGELVVGYLPVT
jgi:hypothetical protein